MHTAIFVYIYFIFSPGPAKNPPKTSKNENVIFGGERAFFFWGGGEKALLKYPKLTGITSKITYPTLHLGVKVRAGFAFKKNIFGPFKGHSSAKIGPNG